MDRTIQYTVTKTHQGMTIKSFLTQKGYSAQNRKELKSYPRGILCNGCTAYVNHMLMTGDELTITIKEETPSGKLSPVCLPLSVVYEDEDLLIIDKPAQMPIHPSLNNHDNSLANGLAWYYRNENSPFIFRCINRLDKDTSGLTIVAKHAVSAGILSSMAARREIQREYLAIIHGKLTPEQGTVTAPISREEGSILKRTVNYEAGKRAVTHYQVLEQIPKGAVSGPSLLSCKNIINDINSCRLVLLKLETGRTHQIRVHMAYLGFPLAGDQLYNSDPGEITRQALHSYRLKFTHPMTSEDMEFTAPLPPDMSSLLTKTPVHGL